MRLEDLATVVSAAVVLVTFLSALLDGRRRPMRRKAQMEKIRPGEERSPK